MCETTNAEDFHALDFFKWVMAIFVVAIHTHPLEKVTRIEVNNIYNYLVSIAVPFFFISTGFLFFRKLDSNFYSNLNFERTKKFILRIFRLYFLWTSIYLPITFYDYFTNEIGVIKNSLLFIRGLFLVGEHFYSWQLWYLLATAYSFILIYLLMKIRAKDIHIFIIAITIFTFGCGLTLLINNIDGLKGFPFYVIKLMSYSFASGRLFTGMVYIVSGMIIARYRLFINKYILIIGLVISIIGLAFLPPILTSFALLVLSIIIFEFAISIKIRDSKVWYHLRKSSTITYFTHMIVFFLYTRIFNEIPCFGVNAFLFTLLGSYLISLIVIKYERKFNFIRVLFS